MNDIQITINPLTVALLAGAAFAGYRKFKGIGGAIGGLAGGWIVKDFFSGQIGRGPASGVNNLVTDPAPGGKGDGLNTTTIKGWY